MGPIWKKNGIYKILIKLSMDYHDYTHIKKIIVPFVKKKGQVKSKKNLGMFVL